MAPFHIRKYQESDRKQVVDLFSKGVVEHIPATFRHTLMLPRTLVFLIGVPLCMLLFSGSWLLALVCSLALLVFLRLLVGYPWKHYVVICLRTDMADIPKSYLSARDSCFWVAECGGQVVGIVGALPVENPPLGKKQLQLFRLSVAMEHRGEGIGKALIRTALQFARDQGYGEVVLDTGIVQRSALALYLRLGFRETGQFFFSSIMRLVAMPSLHLAYQLPSAPEGGL